MKKNLLSISTILATIVSFQAFAMPEGGNLLDGEASIEVYGQKQDRMKINQTSDIAFFEWQSFNIGKNEQVDFNQPSRDSVAYNRVLDTNPSEIAGKLKADGHVVLVNPNGVMFDKNSKIDVGAITVSTADISAEKLDIQSAKFDLPGEVGAMIEANGEISAKGNINLIATSVRVDDKGEIDSDKGNINIAAAETFAIDLTGDGLVLLDVTEQVEKLELIHKGEIKAKRGNITFAMADAKGADTRFNIKRGKVRVDERRNGKVIVSNPN